MKLRDLPVVCVMMSTYNGEKYICEQIDSILRQSNVHVDLYIRDDGSMDSTRDILRAYATSNNNIKLSFGENIGWKKSFMKMLENAPEADFYAFSDQDDVWMADKLSRACGNLEKEENKIALYGSNVVVTDSKLNNVRLYNDKDRLVINRPLKERLDLSRMPGGLTYVFTPDLLKIMCRWLPTGDYGHDFICYLLGTLFGKVIYDSQPSVYYRQHGNNQIGADGGIGLRVKKNMKTLFSKSVPQKSIWASKVLELYPEIFKNTEAKKYLEKLKEYPYDWKIKRELLKDGELRRDTLINTFLLHIKICMNKW